MTLYNLFEQVNSIIKNGSPQEIIQAVKNSYATVVKNNFYQGKQSDLSEIGGSFIYTFNNREILLDVTSDKFYSLIPSTYVDLPHEMGIKYVSFTGSDEMFWRVSNYAMFNGLKARFLGGNYVFEVEGTKMYFPKLTADLINCDDCKKTITMKLAIGLSDVDVDEELNISPDIADQIVMAVVSKFAQPQKNS